jgi:hypothetical protein
MASMEFREGMKVNPATVRRLTKAAVALNLKHGDPTSAAKAGASKGGMKT